MLRAARAFLILLSLTGLASCAPVMLGRTPTPAAPGATKISASASYPVGLTEVPTPFEDGLVSFIDPAYLPLPLPLDVRIAYGRSETLETNVELMVSPGLKGSVTTGTENTGGLFNLGVRYGVKNRFQKAPIELAYDYGGSLYPLSLTAGLDAGILAAVPLGNAKLYGGLRGFVGFFPGIGAAALTVGGEVPLEERQSVMLELTVLANRYNGVEYLRSGLPAPPAPQPIGFTLLPAFTFNF